ncbi:MAG TPA: serine/threonine-protein kinase [Sandaracinaceae bacterium]
MSTSSAEQSSLRPVLPFQLGRFTLCRELGAGGMATVYLARMQLAAGLDRLVALKTIHAHLAKEPVFIDMFLDEAKIASLINHPNVCSVYDFGEVGGTYFLAMEYLLGEPLFDVINTIAERDDEDLRRAGPFLAARIIADACEGLHAAHTLVSPEGKRLEVVHRDVSPQNLVVTYDGSVKVVDFGCAKALERVTQTNTGMMKGKVSYAAPEQLRAEPLDARVDVFALGICLWEFLTLRQLFRRETAIQTAMAVLQEPIPRATEGAPWVPEELADIAEKALARDPNERYQSARELGRALRSFIASSGVPFESAEVAEWMRHLFASRHEEKRALVAEVEAMELSKVAPVARTSTPSARESEAAAGAIANEKTKLAKSTSKPQPVPRSEPPPPPDDDEPVELPTRTGRYVAMIVLLLALIGGGTYAFFRYEPQILAALGMAPAQAPAGEPAEPELPEPASDEGAATEGGAADEGATQAAVPVATVEAHEAAHASAQVAPPSSAPQEGSSAERDRAPHAGAQAAARGRSSAARDREQEAPPAAGTPSPAPVQASATLDFSRGRVRVEATGGGWATVVHEGRELGRTPLTTQLPVGTQQLTLLPYGRGPGRTVTVNVEWGATAYASINVPERRGTEDWGNPY